MLGVAKSAEVGPHLQAAREGSRAEGGRQDAEARADEARPAQGRPRTYQAWHGTWEARGA